MAQSQEEKAMISRNKNYRNQHYLRFIRTQPCIICETKPSEAHHEPLGNDKGWALKPPDSQALPLCNYHNRQREAVPAEEFWDGYDVKKLIIEHLTEYLRIYDPPVA